MQWCNNNKVRHKASNCIQNKMSIYKRQRRHSQPPLPRAQPFKTCSHITTQLLASNRPYRIFNIDVCVILARQHARDIDMTMIACLHKSSPSKLTTYNNNSSDHQYTPNTLHHTVIKLLLHRPQPT